MKTNGRGAPYAWLALWALLRFRGGSDGSDGGELLRISAVAGQFRRPDRHAANDKVVALLVLVMIWVAACDKYRAKFARSTGFSRKMPVRRFHPTIPAESAWLLVFPLLRGSFGLVPIPSPPHTNLDNQKAA